MSRSWGEAFLRQAVSDFQVMEVLLGASSVPKCHCLHYMQMATEKLAKAFVPDTQRKNVHGGFLKFLKVRGRTLAGSSTKRDIRKFGTAKAFDALVKELQPLIWDIDHMAPALSGDGPNAEYPWSRTRGAAQTFLAPVEYAFPNVDPDSVRFRKLMRLVRLILDEAKPAYVVENGGHKHGSGK